MVRIVAELPNWGHKKRFDKPPHPSYTIPNQTLTPLPIPISPRIDEMELAVNITSSVAEVWHVGVQVTSAAPEAGRQPDRFER